MKYLPNVTAPNNGPGQGNIFMRGLSVGSAGSQSSGSIGGFPNVAIYLDDQSGQLPARNLDIYAADLERIEILEGPQGTLFGAGAEAGVVRYITNKPKLNVTEGNVEAGYGTTAHGDPNSDLTAVLNLPLIQDTLAVRAVIYNDRRGGYIDNVPGTFTRKDTDLGIYYANYATACKIGAPTSFGLCTPVLDPVTGKNTNKATSFGVPPGSPAINNNAIAANNINPVTYQGIRASALYQINDDWNVLITQTYQDMDSEGVFYQMPKASDGAPLQADQVTLFNNSYDKDKFENTAWTVNGKIGDLKAVYTGGYLVRHVDQVGDYTNYARGVYADYYQCFGAQPKIGLAATCFSPSTTWRETERNEHMSHEFRLSTPDDWRIRGIVGAFYETNKLFDQTDWLYKTIPNCTSNGAPGTVGNTGCLSDVGTAPNTTVENPGVQNDNVAFFEDTTREVKQFALFGSVDFDIIPRVLTVTAGARHYNFDEYFKGSVTSSFGCYEGGCAGGRMYRRCHQPGCEGSQFQGIRHQEPRESYLSHHAGHHGVPDILAGLPAGRFQPHQHLPHRRAGRRVPVHPAADLSVRQPDELRVRLEDRVAEPPPAVERHAVPGELGQRANGLLRSRRNRQPDFRHQRSELPGQGNRDLDRGTGGAGIDGAGRLLLESERADQFSIIDRQQPEERQLRQAHHRSLHQRHLLQNAQQSIRPDRRPERQLAAHSVQPARAL